MLNFLENHDEQRFGSDFFGKKSKDTMAALAVSLFLNTAPFMVYFGEEVGERGMDHEGFSGRDGRTTIFDWWSIESIKRLRAVIENGSYKLLDVERLVASGMEIDEAKLFVKFASALKIASSDLAITRGTTYDLCYCNYASDGFDKDRHFAFLRDFQDHTVLIAVNFSDTDAHVKFTIPAHAFEWMEIETSETLYPGCTYDVDIPAKGYTMLTLI